MAEQKQRKRLKPIDYLTAGKFKGRMASMELIYGPIDDDEPELASPSGSRAESKKDK